MIIAHVEGLGLADLRVARVKYIEISGHAGSAQHGRDLVCAAVSALSIAFVNAVETLCGHDLCPDVKSGWLSTAVPDDACIQQLARGLVVGLEGLAREHGRYVKLVLKEAVK